VPLVLLHASLVLRLVAGDAAGHMIAWQWGGIITEIALLVFMAMAAFSLFVKPRMSSQRLHSTEPADDNRLVVATTPIGVTCLGADLVSDLVPKCHVCASPIGGVGEPLTLIFGHVVADLIQGDDRHSCCLHDPVYLPGMVFQDLSFPDTRQRL